jgi:dihydrofolate synthase/folylpolyglutamate synthase
VAGAGARAGTYQAANAVLAAAAAHARPGEPAVRGLAPRAGPGASRSCGRAPQRAGARADEPTTPPARALAASLAAYFPGQPVTFVVAIYADKDRAGILEALAPLASGFVDRAEGPRAAPPEELAALAAHAAKLPTACRSRRPSRPRSRWRRGPRARRWCVPARSI